MSLEEIRKKVVEFRKERNWEQFHNPKDLALSLSLEASEVLEIFQWKRTLEEIKETAKEKKEELSEEMADVLLYLVNLADITGIDLKESALKKIEKNAKKYPVKKCRGKSDKYTHYQS
ncbi:MAG: nucleotide pyrophosphohydrolase [Nanoarchaeota archaeon]|nr:nucleotide pyrophosphohydrolase [Nanoarchaeota archaeon]MBU1029745.1 nucleotide pyrophosphohydrolase [Nanoarchaeota archaeon]MBU1849271.1 nucleotide pyrophosphohydrolase [Nanoarchaeota archaeon]